MKYDLSNEFQKEQAITYFNFLLSAKKSIELKKITCKRTLRQNRYLHLILSWFAIEYGDTLEYVKLEIYKKIVNKEYFKSEFVNKKTGEIRVEWLSINNFDEYETAKQITNFRNYSSREAGIYLPSANEYDFLKHIEIEASRYLY